MGVRTGFGGGVTYGDFGGGSEAYFPCVREWSINPDAQTKKIGCSGSNGAPIRVAGNLEVTGQFTAYGHTPLIWPGQGFGFIGTVAADEGVSLNTCRVESVVISCNAESGDPISYVTNFAVSGTPLTELAYGDPADVPDPGPVTTFPSAGLGVSIDKTSPFSAYVALPEVRSWQLTLTTQNPSYASSGTNAFQSRVAGLLDATVQIQGYADATDLWSGNLPDIGEIASYRLYVTSSLYYLLDFGFCESKPGSVDIEGNAIVPYTLNLGLTAFAGTDEGSLVTPGGVTLWSRDLGINYDVS